jgi:hypothetical protein
MVLSCFVAALVVAATACGGDEGDQTAGGKTFRGGGVSFNYPADWRERIPEPGEETSGILSQVKVGPPERAADLVAITVAPIGVRIEGKDLTITEENIDEQRDAAAFGVEFLVSSGGGELSEPTRVTVGGLPGFRWEASHVEIRGAGRLDLLLTQVFKRSTSYLVNCQYTPDGAEEVTAACDQILGSFRAESERADPTGAVLFRDDFSDERSGTSSGIDAAPRPM